MAAEVPHEAADQPTDQEAAPEEAADQEPEPVPAPVSAAAAAAGRAYKKKRTAFAVPEGFEVADVYKVIKPKPGNALSKVWEHVHCFCATSPAAKAAYEAGEGPLWICGCKCCGSTIKNDTLRAAVVMQHFETKANNDYAHKLAIMLMKGPTSGVQTKLLAQNSGGVGSLVEWMTDSLIPLHALSKPSWTAYNKTMDPTYKKPTDDAVCKELARQVEKQRARIVHALDVERRALGGQARKHFHYEVDMWDEGYTKRHFIALLVSFIDVEFDLRTFCLAFFLWEGKAEGFKLADWKKDKLAEYGLSDYETYSNTSDAGSNMKVALEDEGAPWQRCGAHNIANACDDALGKRKRKDPVTEAKVSTHPAAAAFIEKCKMLVAYFKRSGLRLGAMKQEQRELYGTAVTLMSDHFIRWNATERMMQRFLRVREAVIQYFTKYDPQSDAQLSTTDWVVIANLVGVLGPPMQATQILQSKAIMLSDAFGALRTLVKATQEENPVLVPTLTQKDQYVRTEHCDLDEVSRAVRERLSTQLQQRFCEEELLTTPMLLALATDPRTKSLRFLSPLQRRKATALLNAAWKERSDTDASEPVEPEAVEAAPAPKKRRAGQADFLEEFDFFGDVEEPSPTQPARRETELTQFRALPAVPNSPGFSVLKWWKEHAEQFPKLSGLVRSVLGARATSANVERVFSMARGLVSPLRASMSAEKIELWMMNKLNRSL
jgi:hypothetical protein